MAEINALEELQSELTCPVCLELFRLPVILECGHHFCRACITRCWDANRTDELPTTCPKCRKAVASKLRPNSLLCNVVDSVRRAHDTTTTTTTMDSFSSSFFSSSFSSSCHLIAAGEREDAEEREPGSSMSSVASSSSTGFWPRVGVDMCEEHEERLKLYCEDDQLPICLVCGMSRDHKTHNVIPINEAFENYKDKLSVALERVEIQVEEASLFQRHTNDKVLLLKEKAGDLDQQVTAEFDSLREFLRQEEQRIKDKMRKEKEEKLDQLEKALTKATEQISQLEVRANELRLKLEEEENPEQLKGIKDFLRGVEGLFELPLEVSIDLHSGDVLGPLQYRTWRKMYSVLQPAVTAVTLDHDTAYPRLWVSPCRSSVWVGDIQPNLPDNAERFTRYNIVLGYEAFSSGRHYWEVEVGSKSAWGLGVASASVDRKREISLCPDDGFWTVGRRGDRDGGGGEYEACTDAEECPLHPPRPLRRVGIYLDYEGGQVSFYDAGDLSHLFSFWGARFTEPVLPYFNPWPIVNGRNRQPLTVVTPSW